MILGQTLRDLHEFLAAKKRKREPLVWNVKGAGAAVYKPRHTQGFARFRAALRGVGHWGQASERLDALEHALLASHGITFPLPNEVMQNEDRSLSLFWESISVRCFPDGFMSLIGGTAGVPAKKISRELLDALAFQSRLQRAS
jgi:hypothetical protein